MMHASDQGSCLKLHDGPSNLLCGIRDQHANYLAAKIRLQEDEAEAQKLNSVHDGDVNVNQLHLKAVDEIVPLRSILKRKDNSSDVKPCKRVRFEPSCAAAHEEEASEKIQGISMGTTSVHESMSSQNASGLPDYLQNPSKYTRYSFGLSCEVDDTSNAQAFMNIFKSMKNSQFSESASQLEDASAVLPKSVIFIPKKKPGEAEVVNHSSEFKQENVDQSLHQRGFPVGIAARESQGSEVDKVEEDVSEPNVVGKSTNSPKPGRRYQIKSSSNDAEA
uniref:Uncharacterized protein MANES_08G101800 n=1 Tax=Rhizophora mucronata TaxID=61149 RepID=A0A2P2J1W2_RHIMU